MAGEGTPESVGVHDFTTLPAVDCKIQLERGGRGGEARRRRGEREREEMVWQA